MTFTVTYRDKTGAKREEAIEAASRAECVEECRRRGIAPTVIREGGRPREPRHATADGRGKARPSQDGTRGCSPSHGSRRILAVLGTLAILGGGAWWWLAFEPRPGSVPSQEPQPKRATPKEVVPAPRAPHATTDAVRAQATPPAPPAPVKRQDPRPGKPPLLTNIEKNVHGRRTPRPTKVVVSGQLDKDGNPIEPPKPLFEAMGDNHIEQLVNYQPGERFLSIVEPAQIARDFKAHMNDPIEILPDDTPEVAARKRRYIEVRKAIVEDMRNGADLEEMIVEAKRTLDKIASMREQYAAMLEEEKKAGTSDDDLDDLASAATALLKKHGANPILSPRQEEMEMLRKEEESARKAEESAQKGKGEQ